MTRVTEHQRPSVEEAQDLGHFFEIFQEVGQDLLNNGWPASEVTQFMFSLYKKLIRDQVFEMNGNSIVWIVDDVEHGVRPVVWQARQSDNNYAPIHFA